MPRRAGRRPRPIVTELTPDEQLAGLLARGRADRRGRRPHAHAARAARRRQAVRQRRQRRLAVRGRSRGAYWAILDEGVELRRTDYDLERAAELVRASGTRGPRRSRRRTSSSPRREPKRSASSADDRSRQRRPGRQAARARRLLLRRARERGRGALRQGRDAARRRRAGEGRRLEALRRPPGDPARPRVAARRRARRRRATSCRRPARTSTTSSSSSASTVEEEGGRPLGRVTALHPGPANDALELDSGLLLPLVAACVQQVDLEAGRILVARASPTQLTCRCPVQLDVFTLLPHAFAWLTEQRPVAAVLGDGARAAPAQLPRLHAARATARSTTSRTAAARGWCCASTSSRRRSTRSTAARRGTAWSR